MAPSISPSQPTKANERSDDLHEIVSSVECRRQMASSSDTGTFTTLPKLVNQYYEDSSLNRVMHLFMPQDVIERTAKDLSRFGQEAISKQVFDWISDAERNLPYLRGSGRDAFGRRTNELVTSEGWRKLQEMGLREGIVALGYENTFAEHSRVVQFVKYHLWCASSALVTCPSAMQDGAAALLKRHIEHAESSTSAETVNVFSSAYEKLTSRAPTAWTSGQWMTERVGGSDVSGTETVATYYPAQQDAQAVASDGEPLGPWIIDGFKWFSSATDSQMTILLAQTPNGLSTFYAPMRRVGPNGELELNGINIQRLKNKLGTKSLPTAELELKGMRAHLVGNEGDGIREISTLLNITRTHNSVSAMSFLGRGLAIAKAFADVRELAGKGNRKLLRDIPLHVQTLAHITLDYRANMLFTYFVVSMLGAQEHGIAAANHPTPADRIRPNNAFRIHFLRILTPVMKALTAKTSIRGLQECVEALGGVGYLENEESQHINIARIYRDANVLSIWEGTTNILGTDFAKILKGRFGNASLTSLQEWAQNGLYAGEPSAVDLTTIKDNIRAQLGSYAQNIMTMNAEEVVLKSRDLMQQLFVLVTGVLMVVDAERDGDEVSVKLLQRFAKSNGLSDATKLDWKAESEWDKRIVFGQGIGDPSPRARI